jgi:hypothetical protein
MPVDQLFLVLSVTVTYVSSYRTCILVRTTSCHLYTETETDAAIDGGGGVQDKVWWTRAVDDLKAKLEEPDNDPDMMTEDKFAELVSFPDELGYLFTDLVAELAKALRICCRVLPRKVSP